MCVSFITCCLLCFVMLCGCLGHGLLGVACVWVMSHCLYVVLRFDAGLPRCLVCIVNVFFVCVCVLVVVCFLFEFVLCALRLCVCCLVLCVCDVY